MSSSAIFFAKSSVVNGDFVAEIKFAVRLIDDFNLGRVGYSGRDAVLV